MASEKLTRRRVLQVMAGSTLVATIALPGKWIRPVVESVIVPAHAVASFPFSTTTTTTLAASTAAPTTSAAPTTTLTTTSTTPPPSTTGST